FLSIRSWGIHMEQSKLDLGVVFRFQQFPEILVDGLSSTIKTIVREFQLGMFEKDLLHLLIVNHPNGHLHSLYIVPASKPIYVGSPGNDHFALRGHPDTGLPFRVGKYRSVKQKKHTEQTLNGMR